VGLGQLDGINFVAFDRDIPTRRAVDKLLRDHGSTVQVTMELDNIETVKRAVEIGLGISILPRNAVLSEITSGTLAEVAIADGDFIRPIAMLVRKGRSLSRAAQVLIETFSNEGPRVGRAGGSGR
jgi:DNA-binding transcriptional LysR family regulator